MPLNLNQPNNLVLWRYSVFHLLNLFFLTFWLNMSIFLLFTAVTLRAKLQSHTIPGNMNSIMVSNSVSIKSVLLITNDWRVSISHAWRQFHTRRCQIIMFYITLLRRTRPILSQDHHAAYEWRRRPGTITLKLAHRQ